MCVSFFFSPRQCHASHNEREQRLASRTQSTTKMMDKNHNHSVEQQSEKKATVAPLESDSLLPSKNEHEETHPTMLDTITEGVLHRMDSFVETSGEVAQEVQEAVVEEIHHAEDALLEELKEADEGDVFFLEMSLTRNLSILPGDRNLAEAVNEAAELIVPEHHHEHDDKDDEEVGLDKDHYYKKQETTTTPLSAYLLLISAVIALSSIGPFLDLQVDVEPCMKIYWRMTGTAMLLAPLAIRSVFLHDDAMPRLTATQWCTFFVAAASYAVMCVAFVLALDYTSVGNAVILANSQSLILLAGKLCVGAPLLLMEGVGALVAFMGAVLCSRDHSSMSASAEDTAGWSTLYGDCLAMISAIGGVFYLVFGKSLRTSAIQDVYVFMFLIMLSGSFLTLLYMLSTGQEVTFSRDVNTGMFGWMNMQPNRFPLEVATVVVCNFMGSLGYVRAFQYFDNLVISVAALMEPVVATFIAFLFGVGMLPGAMGWIGNVLVATGTLAVVYPTVGDSKGGAH